MFSIKQSFERLICNCHAPLQRRRLDATNVRDMVVLALLAGLMFILQAIAWPLVEGRDAATYILHYLGLFDQEPLYPMMMLWRTPLTPLFFGITLQFGGVCGVEAALGVCYVLTILAMYRIGLFWGRGVGWLVAGALLLHAAFGAMYHVIGSDGLSATAITFVVLAAFRSGEDVRIRRAVELAVIVFVAILVRPTCQVLLALGCMPLLFHGVPWRGRLRQVLVFGLSSGALIGSLCVYNGVRFHDFTVTRGGAACIPLYRTFLADRIVSPHNGPYSRALADAVARDLLTREPYASYHIDLREFFAEGCSRMWVDLLALCDREWGWDNDYRVLQRVGWESVKQHPRIYFEGLYDRFWSIMRARPKLKAPKMTASLEQPVVVGATNELPTQRIQRRADGLPEPSEGKVIPQSNVGFRFLAPEQHYQWDWDLFYREGAGRILDERLGERVTQRAKEHSALVPALPRRDGDEAVNGAFYNLSYKFPRMLACLLAGLLGVLQMRERRQLVLSGLCVTSLLLVVATLLATPAWPEYRQPLDPVFILCGIIGLRAVFSQLLVWFKVIGKQKS